MIHIKSLACLFAVAGVLAACSSTPVTPTGPTATPEVRSTPSSATPTQSAAPRPAPAPVVTAAPLPAYLDPKNPISTERSVYFDFDEFAIKPEYTGLIERQGKYLASNPSVAIKIEGNTDERGGSEYNLALGQKRAEAVLRALQIYGVKASQMEAVSWGEERPKSAGHDEAAWAQNRRADLQYPRQ
jgi:peptidoglycan-associated lipoprotein